MILPPPPGAVVVVDDEASVCHLTARMLEEAGFRVLEAHSGPEAIALLSTFGTRITLVVSDNRMPQMTGEDLAAIMGKNWPAVPILLVSGQGAPGTGYTGTFLRKPFTAEALLSAVARLLSSTSAR